MARRLLHATRHLAVHRVEHLALAGVDDRDDDAVGVAVRERQQVERGDPDHRHPQRVRQGLAGGEADPHPGEQPGPDVDGDAAELGEPDVGLARRRSRSPGPASRRAGARGRPRTVAITPSCPPMATLTCSVAVSIPRISMRHAASRPLDSRRPARGPVATGGADLDRRRASASPSIEVEPHDEVLAERPGDDIAPLDEHDAVGLGQLAERQVGDLGVLVEAVEVGVMQRRPPAVVAVHQRECRRRDRLGDAERPAEALGERRLAGAHLPGEHDDVTRRAEPGQGGGDRVGVGDQRESTTDDAT